MHILTVAERMKCGVRLFRRRRNIGRCRRSRRFGHETRLWHANLRRLPSQAAFGRRFGQRLLSLCGQRRQCQRNQRRRGNRQRRTDRRRNAAVHLPRAVHRFDGTLDVLGQAHLSVDVGSICRRRCCRRCRTAAARLAAVVAVRSIPIPNPVAVRFRAAGRSIEQPLRSRLLLLADLLVRALEERRLAAGLVRARRAGRLVHLLQHFERKAELRIDRHGFADFALDKDGHLFAFRTVGGDLLTNAPYLAGHFQLRIAFGQLADEVAERLNGDVERLHLRLEGLQLRVLGGARRFELND